MGDVDRVVVYWGSHDGRTGWCYEVHRTGDAGQGPTAVALIPGRVWGEAEAVAWVQGEYPGVPVDAREGDAD